MSNRRESVGRKMARQQSMSGTPTMEMVSVAVLPPRLPKGVAPVSASVISGAVSWDESINWEHNDPIEQPGDERKKSFLKKAGLTTQRQRRHSDKPPFTMRQVPYDTWRKHYAKDKDGNYRGTHAPAEDCLLKPDDVAKWRLEPPKTKADQWTRGSEVLPVYSEVQSQGRVPDYEFESFSMAPEPSVEDYASVPPADPPAPQSFGEGKTGKVIAGGKTAQDIIEEAKMKKEQGPASKGKGWKGMLKRGFETASMGSGAI